MSNNAVVMVLAKVMVATAWVDGQVSNEEINSLKDLLFHLPGMTASDWAEIDIYIDSPVGEAERERLVSELVAALSSPADIDLALQALDQMVNADGQLGPGEQEAAEQLKKAIQENRSGLSRGFSRFVRSSTQRRAQVVENSPNREIYLDDFVKNKVYYTVARRLEQDHLGAEIAQDQLRKLSLAGGLMARMAYVDRQVTDAEFQSMVSALQTHWGLATVEAALVTEVAVSEIGKGLDYFRLTREFFECTSEQERVSFLDVLFAVTSSDGRASYDEIEEIRKVANGLKLTHQQFIDAKLKVPADLR